jgi:hypothetical protein
MLVADFCLEQWHALSVSMCNIKRSLNTIYLVCSDSKIMFERLRLQLGQYKIYPLKNYNF